jgi:hypothetical protein
MIVGNHGYNIHVHSCMLTRPIPESARIVLQRCV